MEIKLALNPKTVELYEDELGNKHDSKLHCLLANKRIAIRGIIQSDEAIGTRTTLLVQDVVAVVDKNMEKFLSTIKAFDRAILKERKKGGQAT